jgi:hypothetical protein
MNIEQYSRQGDAFARRYEYDDETVYALDVGRGLADASVDVVDGTVVVVPRDPQADQLELEVDGSARAFLNNGVLTVEVDR